MMLPRILDRYEKIRAMSRYEYAGHLICNKPFTQLREHLPSTANNLIMSPLSLGTVLAWLAHGAVDQSQEELLNFFGLPKRGGFSNIDRLSVVDTAIQTGLKSAKEIMNTEVRALGG